MTDQNKRANIEEELARVHEAFAAANLLAQNGYYKDAVSRLYYSVLHVVRALLLSKGLEPKSHEGTLTLFASHFVKIGLFQPADSHVFSRLMKYRQEADYSPSYPFTQEDFNLFRTDAEGLIERIKRYLGTQGYP